MRLMAGEASIVVRRATRMAEKIAAYLSLRRFAADKFPPASLSTDVAKGASISTSPWTPKDAEKHYNMLGWGQGFFRVNPEGHVTVHPDPARATSLDLYRIALDLNAQGIQLPLLIRFSDILRSRASYGSPAVPTTSMDSSLPSASAAIFRTKAESSTMRTRILGGVDMVRRPAGGGTRRAGPTAAGG